MKRTKSWWNEAIAPVLHGMMIAVTMVLVATTFSTAMETTPTVDATAVTLRREIPQPPQFGVYWTSTPSLEWEDPHELPQTLRKLFPRLPLPFASQPELGRSVLDCDLRDAWRKLPKKDQTLDATQVDAFQLTFATEDAAAIGSVTLYLRSGNGWYGMSPHQTGVSHPGGITVLTFSPGDCRIEGTPAGPDRIDGFRLAFWRGTARDSGVRLMSLRAMRYPILIVESSAAGPEGNSGRRCAQGMDDLLRGICGGICFARQPESDLTPAMLEDRDIVILPYNPGMSDPAATLLTQWLESGHATNADSSNPNSSPSPKPRLVAFYQLPTPLLRAAGFDRLEYVRSPDDDAALAAVRFSDVAQNDAGYPSELHQHSHNINAPVSAGGDMKTLGTWYDAAGRETAWPALAATDRAIFFSHVLLGQDAENQRQMVTAMFGETYPQLWHTAALTALSETAHIGHRDNTDWMRKLPPAKQTLTTKELASFPSLGTAINEYEQIAATWRGNSLFSSAASTPERNRELRAAIARLGELKQLFTDVYIRSFDAPPPGEVRAWWEHAGTGMYPGDWNRTMRELSEAGFTHVIPNMLWAGSAHYKSDYLPSDDAYRKYGDQIAQAVAAGKLHGIQVHIWKVNYNLDTAPQSFIDQMREEHRTQVKADGSPQRWLCPSHPANQELEIASMCEIVEKYDVNGIHFDYIRYPSDDVCFCDGCRERFESQTDQKVKNWPDDCYRGELKDAYTDWRCEQITKVVAGVHERAKRIRPTIQISAAVFPLHPECRRWVLQDWPVWVHAGYLDFVCPMSYNADPTAFAEWVDRNLEQVDGKIPVYPGIGATATGIAMTPDIVAAEIAVTRHAGAAGFTIFNLDARTADRLLQRLRPLFIEISEKIKNHNHSEPTP